MRNQIERDMMTPEELNQKMDDLMGSNICKPLIKVKHRYLLRSNEESIYRSICPICELGALLIRRESVGGALSKTDTCILCAQQFEYVDLDEIESQDSKTMEAWESFKRAAIDYDELHVYCCIDELGACIWRINHSAGKGHIPKSDMVDVQNNINYMHQMSGFLFKLTTKFGVRVNNDITPTESYRRWYAWWKAYFTNMTDDEWRQFERDLASGDTQGYRPEGDWKNDQDIKFQHFNFILGEVKL